MARAPFDPNSLRDGNAPADLYARLPNERTPCQKAIGQIKGMLVGDEYAYAEQTLRNILLTLEETGRVTQRQLQSIENIAAKPTQGSDRGRRHGGW